jgi:hypothetical protein
VRVRVAAVALVVLSAAACGASSKAPVIGVWQGTLHQTGLPPFTVKANVRSLKSPERNSVHYTGIDCNGHWTYLGRSGSAYRFREVITGGRSATCKGSGTVTLTPAPRGDLRYVFRGGGVVSRGLLSRSVGLA